MRKKSLAFDTSWSSAVAPVVALLAPRSLNHLPLVTGLRICFKA
jgi:hypothetical protein